MNKLFSEGKKVFLSEQHSLLSAAGVIMAMTITSQILGLVGKRILLHFFPPTQLSLFFAAFRLPDLVFEVLIFGMFASAFIPVFTKAIRKSERDAWEIAGRVVNIGLVGCGIFAIIFGLLAENFYAAVAPGFSPSEIHEIATLARLLFIAQGFFVISYVLTGVLESMKRFLIPALAPVFYNLGLIIGTLVLAPHIGLYGPVVGVIVGAMVHFLIQLPLATRLGFRFVPHIKPNEGVMDIAHLAAPRLIDLSFQQIIETVALSFASVISKASYAYFTLASSLQSAPARLFGVSLAKAALPTLTTQADDPKEFSVTLLGALYQIYFLILPVATMFIVLRIPTIRLVFGESIFDWNSTVQTGMVLSAFAVGIVFQATVALLARAFYALHDTRTPVIVSVIGDTLIIIFDFILVRRLGLPVWALAASVTIGAFAESVVLLVLLNRRIKHISLVNLTPILKSIFAAFVSGWAMYFLLKFFDKWVWVTRPSFVSKLDISSIAFDKFVLDTRYTISLFILTAIVALIGIATYIIISLILRSRELWALIHAIGRR